MLPWFFVRIGMSRYWWVSIQASGILHCVIMRSMGQRMPFESSQVRWNCLWIPRCVTHVPLVGWSCRWSLLMLVIIRGSTWVYYTTLKEFYITILGHCCCNPQRHIHRILNIALLMGWQRLCCWLGIPWLWHVGGISSIVGDIGDEIVGAVVVPIVSLSSVSSVAGLRSTVLVVWHVLRDWASQSTITVYLF